MTKLSQRLNCNYCTFNYLCDLFGKITSSVFFTFYPVNAGKPKFNTFSPKNRTLAVNKYLILVYATQEKFHFARSDRLTDTDMQSTYYLPPPRGITVQYGNCFCEREFNRCMFNLVANPSTLITKIIHGVFRPKCLYFAKT